MGCFELQTAFFYEGHEQYSNRKHAKHLQILETNLILSQTTNFRLFQTERVCRRQFHI